LHHATLYVISKPFAVGISRTCEVGIRVVTPSAVGTRLCMEQIPVDLCFSSSASVDGSVDVQNVAVMDRRHRRVYFGMHVWRKKMDDAWSL
jgi:hypothetical protein